jgi:hypothetical protein
MHLKKLKQKKIRSIAKRLSIRVKKLNNGKISIQRVRRRGKKWGKRSRS